VPALDELFTGTEAQPPSDAPPPAKNKSVWEISCGQQIPACAGVAEAAGEAAKALGWDYHVADGNLGIAGGYPSAIRTALAAKPDALLLHGFSCDFARQPLEEAKSQGVLVMGIENLDCSDVGGEKLFTVDSVYTDTAKNNVAFWTEYGARAADFVIAKSGGTAKIINTPGPEPLQQAVDQGFLNELKKCTGCSIVDTVMAPNEAMTPNGPWIQAFRSSLVKHPDATAAYMVWDFQMASLGGAQAIRESGLDLLSFGGQGQSDTTDLIHRGLMTGNASARDAGWAGWAAMDNLNRAFNGQPSVPQGVGFVTIDKDHNLPPVGENYHSKIDFKSVYLKAWKVKQ
jgi:ribose transport system substrate-binding protein